MRVLLVRHARAVDGHVARSDSLRWLTPEGRHAMRGVAGAVHELGLRPTRMFTSPLVRAVQTAEILASIEPFDGPLEVWPALAPDEGTTVQALAPLEGLLDEDTIVLVGHEPRIRIMAGQLLGVPHMPGFRTGAACLVRWTPGAHAALEWMLDPVTREPLRSLEQVR